mmetsp:Transcript_25823/g.49025  ORF Transcript_25823/g.49025 Transcript_25823/m.49025 type:complete len:489 (+) Transcript_25823:100-1566(+)
MSGFFKDALNTLTNSSSSESSSSSKFKGKGHVIGTKADQARLQEEKHAAASSAAQARATGNPGSAYSNKTSLDAPTTSSSASSVLAPFTKQRQAPGAFQGKGQRLSATPDARQLDASTAAAVAAVDRGAGPAKPARRAAAPTGAGTPAATPPTHSLSVQDFQSKAQAGRALASAVADDDTVDALAVALSQLMTAPDSAQQTVSLISKVLGNVLSDPNNAKFRRLRLSNAKIQEAIVDASGGLEYLQASGFTVEFEDLPDGSGTEGYAILPEGESRTAAARAGAAFLQPFSVTPTAPAPTEPAQRQTFGPGNRQEQVFVPADRCAAAFFNPSDSFFNFTPAELKEQALARKQQLEESQQLTTKAYKERQSAKKRTAYTTTTIRVRLPDGVILQGCFAAGETVTSLREWICACLRAPEPFQLFGAGSQKPLQDMERDLGQSASCKRSLTLQDAGLVPSALLNFKWEHGNKSEDIEVVLQPELMRAAKRLE